MFAESLIGIELMRMLREGQFDGEGVEELTVAEQFYKLVA